MSARAILIVLSAIIVAAVLILLAGIRAHADADEYQIIVHVIQHIGKAPEEDDFEKNDIEPGRHRHFPERVIKTYYYNHAMFPSIGACKAFIQYDRTFLKHMKLLDSAVWDRFGKTGSTRAQCGSPVD